MWIYESANGRFSQQVKGAEALAAICYSGRGNGKNNPELQQVQGVGPIPTGEYEIGPVHDTDTHGPVVMALTPIPDVQVFGRSGFLIHGDSIAQPGSASHGCIIAPRAVRERVASSGDRRLLVIRGKA